MTRDSLSRDDLSHFQTIKKFLNYAQLVKSQAAQVILKS